MSRRRSGLPAAVHVLTVALAGAAVGVGAATGSSGFSGEPWSLAPLAATLVASGMIQLEIHYRGEKNALDLFEAALLPLLAVFAGPGAIAMTAATKFVSQRLLGVAWPKVAFNVAQWSFASGVASAVYLGLRDGAGGEMGALAVAMGVAVVVNHLSVAGVLSLVQGRPYGLVVAEMTKAVAAGMFLTDLINVSFGLLFATVMVERPELSVLFLAPLAVLGWAHRSYAALDLDRARIEALQVATHHLNRSAPAAALPNVLEAIRSAFDSSAVCALLSDGLVAVAGEERASDVARELAAASSTGTNRVLATGTSQLAGVLRDAGRRSGLVASLDADGRKFGHLVSIDRSGTAGFDDGELAIFQALAAEIAGALRRWELQAALVTERAHLFEIVDRSSDGIFTVGADGAIGDWNPAMATITGFSAAEAKGGAPAALLRPSVGGSGEPMALERWKADGAPGAPTDLEIITRSGETRTLQCSFSETASEPTSLVVMARDVTKQRELDRLRDDFVATVSHELRTPLTTIVGFTSMLMEPPRPLTDAERDDAVAMVRKGARRLERLIYNLLEVSRIEHRDAAAPAPVDIRDAIENSVAELRENFPLRDIRVDAGSGAVRAIGTQLSVEQILTNLLGNALKYSEHGPIEVTVKEAPDHLVVSVRDHGPGIPHSEQERIFERFHRVDQQHVQAGTGLGLYISRRLARTMGGDLTVESTPGQGATFSLRLPAEVYLVAVG